MRILRVIRPVEDGIVFEHSGMHAVEDYIVSRFQMYMQVYFHPASRAVELILQNLLKRAQHLYPEQQAYFQKQLLDSSFFEKKANLADYIALDDGVMNTYFKSG